MWLQHAGVLMPVGRACSIRSTPHMLVNVPYALLPPDQDLSRSSGRIGEV